MTIKTKIVLFDQKSEGISAQLVQQLNLFLNQEGTKHHHKTAENLFDPNRAGELAVFYNSNDKIVGFIRIIREPFRVNHKEYTLSTAAVHVNANNTLEQEAAKFFFMQSMKYKLNHPQEDMVHVALVDKPETYHFVLNLCTQVYPKPKANIPEPLIKLSRQLKKAKKWSSPANHPMVIKFGETGSITEQSSEPGNQADYYQRVNPHYQQGDSLLTCIPLSITNICYGIKKLISHHQANEEMAAVG